MTSGKRWAVIATLIALGVGCWSIPVPPGDCGETSGTQSSPLLPMSWEVEVEGLYENRGASTIEKLGHRYVLTIYCSGVHSVYAQAVDGLNLDEYTEKFVRVRYSYSTIANAHIYCIQAPCPPVAERVAVIRSVLPQLVSEVERAHYQSTCSVP
jgi:hypothetical protein